jgi:hypothetical protein
MGMEITFTNLLDFELEPPQPAAKFLPEWYKDTPLFATDSKIPMPGTVEGASTIKRCLPIFDAITAGYIITSPADIYTNLVTQYLPNGKTREVREYSWPTANLIAFHPIDQAKNYPFKKGTDQEQSGTNIPKFMNPWGIQTPKGYSCLFIQPVHRESVFTIMTGIVDTDTYFGNINFPFTLTDPTFEGIIPKGTPWVQVIPFKRTSWERKLGNKEDRVRTQNHNFEIRTTFFDYYRRKFHMKKEYR